MHILFIFILYFNKNSLFIFQVNELMEQIINAEFFKIKINSLSLSLQFGYEQKNEGEQFSYFLFSSVCFDFCLTFSKLLSFLTCSVYTSPWWTFPPNKMTVSFHMFCSFVKYWVWGTVNCSLIVQQSLIGRVPWKLISSSR